MLHGRCSVVLEKGRVFTSNHMHININSTVNGDLVDEFSETRVRTWGCGFNEKLRAMLTKVVLGYCEETVRGIHLTPSKWDILYLAYN